MPMRIAPLGFKRSWIINHKFKVASWLGHANRRVACFGRVLPCDAGSSSKAAGKVFASPHRIQRKLLTLVHTLFTAWFNLNVTHTTGYCLKGRRTAIPHRIITLYVVDKETRADGT